MYNIDALVRGEILAWGYAPWMHHVIGKIYNADTAQEVHIPQNQYLIQLWVPIPTRHQLCVANFGKDRLMMEKHTL